MKAFLKKSLLLVILCSAFVFAQEGISELPANPNAPAGNAGGGAPVLGGIRTPFVLGGALGFGSGTGVGDDRGIGLRQIEPMVGIWFPALGVFRVGYGMYNYEEDVESGKDYEVDHSELDFELGVHLLGEVYLMGSYSRVKELSDLGDVAWNEWGLGFGSILFIYSKTMMFAEVAYRWVLSHYDPFMDKKVHGGRIQMNLGFAAYVF